MARTASYLLLVFCILSSGPLARAEDDFSSAPEEKKVEVDQLKKKFGAQRAAEDVVQQRLYSKAQRFDLSAFGGIVDSDPFLLTRTVGGSLGYHFDEYYSVHVLAWKSFTFASDALHALETQARSTANTDEPRGFYAGVFRASFIYGKLNFLQLSILYYDLYAFAGIGRTVTETGSYLTPVLGAGQQFYLSKSFAVKMDFYWMRYKHTILEKADPATRGKNLGTLISFSTGASLGVSYLF